jgi:sugar lactone lactonase YvrE
MKPPAISVHPGTLETVAGNGIPAFGGDGGPARLASLCEPKSVALDERGHLYIADSENHVVRKVDLATGSITTVAGEPPEQQRETSGVRREARGALGEASTGVFDECDPLGEPPASAKGFTQTKDLSGTVRFVVGTAPKEGRFSGDGGPAVRARLNFPSAVAIDADGHLYIADTMNHRVRRVDAVTGVMTTVAGTGHARFSGDGGPACDASLAEPSALAIDRRGALYIADQGNHRVRKINPTNGLITTVAGSGIDGYTGDGGAATQAGLAGPSGLAYSPEGRLYIADTFNGRIRVVDLARGIIATVAGDGGVYRYQGSGEERSMSLSRPYGIALTADERLLITDSDNHVLRLWAQGPRGIVVVAGLGPAGFNGDGRRPQESALNYPFGVAADAAGAVYIADTFNHRIRCLVL